MNRYVVIIVQQSCFKGNGGIASMADRFEKFTERAHKVLTLAQEEAVRLRHNHIGTEHLLLGLVREGNGLAAKVLTELGVNLETIRDDVESIIGHGDRIVRGQVGLTPRAKKVIELAVDEARRLNHHYIGTEHLLLGLIREGNGVAAGVLEQEGLHLGEIRRQVMQSLNSLPTPQMSGKLLRPYAVVTIALLMAAIMFVALRRRFIQHL
jgi:ATP-dependent Clp protease ATP-binding subunit ClpC